MVGEPIVIFGLLVALTVIIRISVVRVDLLGFGKFGVAYLVFTIFGLLQFLPFFFSVCLHSGLELKVPLSDVSWLSLFIWAHVVNVPAIGLSELTNEYTV